MIMATPGSCDKATSDANEVRASKRPAQLGYCPIPVIVLATDPAKGTITLSAPDETGASKPITARWGNEADMWAACPSSLPSSATADDNGTIAGPMPAAPATGTLFLSVPFVKNNKLRGTPKWPVALAPQQQSKATDFATLKIWPTSITIKGFELADNGVAVEASIDVLNGDIATSGQTIRFVNEVMELEVSRDAFGAFGIKFPG
jgi:hypothetical protein